MRDPASFRDPSGFVYFENDEVRRRINPSYLPVYRRLINSGLYKKLVQSGSLIPHREIPESLPPEEGLVIAPLRIPMITYPCEWSFGMLKDAALLTLHIHLTALNCGMFLKDASAYNVQFIGCRPVFIDTLSFEEYKDGSPWYAYGQFCRHFLAPLLLMRHTDIRLNQLLRLFPDGVPLDLAKKLLHGHGGLTALFHISLHSQFIDRHGNDNQKDFSEKKLKPMTLSAHSRLISNLINAIEKMEVGNIRSDWGNYYSGTNYSISAASGKAAAVEDLLNKIRAKRFFDLGANDGRYTRPALKHGAELAAAADSDSAAVEFNYQSGKKNGENILPLITDISNPVGGMGFAASERLPFWERAKPDCIMMLALIHHLVISNNLPLDKIAAWLYDLTPDVILEFVPKKDSQVQRLLACRADIFPEYEPSQFESIFSRFFQIEKKIELKDCSRTVYWFHRKHLGCLRQPFVCNSISCIANDNASDE